MLIGNVGAEPEVKYIDQGVCVASLRLATTERGYKLAEIVENYVHKGDKLFIEGQIHSRSYEDRNGIRHNVTEIWAESLETLSPKTKTEE